MNEPIEIQFPAMFAFVSFSDVAFTEVNHFYEDVRQFDSIVLAVDEQAFAARQAGAIVAKRMVIATMKTQNNLEASPEEIRKHHALAKVAFLVEFLRWTTKNQALRRQPRRQAANLLTSRYVFTWKCNDDGTRYTLHADSLSMAVRIQRHPTWIVSLVPVLDGASVLSSPRPSNINGGWHPLTCPKPS